MKVKTVNNFKNSDLNQLVSINCHLCTFYDTTFTTVVGVPILDKDKPEDQYFPIGLFSCLVRY